MSNSSRRHHYLPKCYLKGFTNKKKLFYVYDRIKKTIRETNTKDSFFENDRNTTFMNGKKDDWLEGIYASMETDVAPVLAKVIKSDKTNPNIDHTERLQLSLFISFLCYRVPSSDMEVEQLIDKKGVDCKYFNIIDRNTGESAVENVLDEFIFPIATNRCIVNCNELPKQNLSRAFCIELGAAILHQSKRFVCSNNESYLRKIAKYYDFYRKQGKENEIIDNIFDYKHMD